MTSPKTVLCTVRVYNTLLSVVSEDLDGFMQQTDNNARLLLLLLLQYRTITDLDESCCSFGRIQTRAAASELLVAESR